ncbi:hypothetical protein XF_2104 [Xylella fastidiosa 9a5c]|uniref:Uncharacterized protein n=1 Tax=Xylella fastidiosa (strain 9a5c) TaxID=160492 RepID=Q9PBN6_XYLFA|nr:hypothetical protein XF_2104 [Xylella fastidiosa 9a5c]
MNIADQDLMLLCSELELMKICPHCVDTLKHQRLAAR